MKKVIVLLFCLFSTMFISFAQKVDIDWTTYFSGQLTYISAVIYEPVCNCIYITGSTADSTGIATPGRHKSELGPATWIYSPVAVEPINWKTDIFLAKFDLEGNQIWGTYFGGAGTEQYAWISVDTFGNIIIAGTTTSTSGIATAGTFIDTKLTENPQMFVAKFNPEGFPIWGSYIGPESYADINGNLISTTSDNNGNVYLASNNTLLYDYNIATPGAFMTEPASDTTDGFIIKFDNTGNRVWATYLGGESFDNIQSIKISKSGYLYVAGITNSITGIGTSGTYQPDNISVNTVSGFINKFSLDGDRIWGTYISSDEIGLSFYNDGIDIFSLDIDANDNVYIAGTTNLIDNVSTPGVYQESFSGGFKDFFLMKFDANGQRKWGTYYGGSADEHLSGSAYSYWGQSKLNVSADGRGIYIAGGYMVTGYEPVATHCTAYTPTGDVRGFAARFDSTGNLNWSTHYDEFIGDATISRPKNEDGKSLNHLFYIGRTPYNGLATPGAHKVSKEGLFYSGLIGKFKEYCDDDTVSIYYSYPMLIAESGFELYSWYHNDILVAESSDNYFEISDTTGFYYCIAKNCNCDYKSNSISFSSTNISDTSVEKDIEIYPNPTNDILSVRLGDLVSGDISIEVLDLLGRVLQVHQININRANQSFVIDISKLPSGVYFLRLTTASNLSIYKKIIKD